jgi:tetratricopeptide (TPR) repeat protein
VPGRRGAGSTLLVLALTLVAAGCASRAPQSAVTSAELARAHALVSIGCHACLQEAVHIYERSRPRGTARAAVDEQAHEAYLLLAFRERELGLPASEAHRRAAALATPASLPEDVLDRVLEILGEPQHLPDGEADKLADAMAPLVQALSARAAGSLAAAYALTTVTCRTFGRAPDASADEPPLARWRETSVAIQYAELACASAVAAGDVEILLGADSRFAEVHYLAGMSELQQGRLRSAYVRLAKAGEAFPGSHAVMSALANVALAIGRIDEALGYYERALEVRDDPAARLGRAKALTYLERHDEAIDALGALVEAGTWSPGEARYWRAWNLYHLSQHHAARRDALRALQSWPSPHVERLAGLTALALDRHDEARGHFEQALTRAGDDCESRLYLAQLAALDGFEAAAACFARAAADRQQWDAEHESVASTAREIERLERWRASSIYSAAISAKVLGRRARALEHASRLLDDPELGSLARDFILDIDVPAAPGRPAPAAPGAAGLPPAS